MPCRSDLRPELDMNVAFSRDSGARGVDMGGETDHVARLVMTRRNLMLRMLPNPRFGRKQSNVSTLPQRWCAACAVLARQRGCPFLCFLFLGRIDSSCVPSPELFCSASLSGLALPHDKDAFLLKSDA